MGTTWKKFTRVLIREMQAIRYKLDDLPNSEDMDEVMAICLELSADLEGLEEQIHEKFKL
jgi:hypothetical protein